MPSCAFEKCRNHSRKENKAHGITFHAFPQDECWCYKWVQVVRKQRREPEWTPTRHSRVCSLHFRPGDTYTTEKGRKKITNGAVPRFQDPLAAKRSRTASSNSDGSSDSDSKERHRTPQNTFLKRKIGKMIADRKRLLQVNVNLKKQNKRLVLKCRSLKGIVVHLHKNISDLESNRIK